jgi:aryl-alcohol dehydrogenase-like predicted oxidoreductase
MHTFGKTNMNVSTLGLGTNRLAKTSFEEASRVLHSALDCGLTVIDTAECYGQSEEIIGRAVSHRRSDYYLFTKCGHAESEFPLPDWHPHLLELSIDRSLRRLKTDYLDLIQLHSCSEQILRRGEVIDVLQRARDAGKVRYIGYSGDRHAARYAVECGAFDALQVSINIADQEAFDHLLPAAKAKQMGIIAKRPLANVTWKSRQKPEDPIQAIYWQRLAKLRYGFLNGDIDEAVSIALRFTLNAADVAIVGTTNPDRIQKNLALLAASSLSEQQFENIRVRWKTATWWRKWLPGSRWGWQAVV